MPTTAKLITVRGILIPPTDPRYELIVHLDPGIWDMDDDAPDPWHAVLLNDGRAYNLGPAYITRRLLHGPDGHHVSLDQITIEEPPADLAPQEALAWCNEGNWIV